MLVQPKTLVLFVHGFLGNETSFANFPLDLIQSIRQQYKIRNLEARVFPFFSTAGDPNKAVHMLYNWLILNGTQPEYDAVIIIAHSMGGLIAADAIRKLWEVERNIKEPMLTRPKSFVLASGDLKLGDLRPTASKQDLKNEVEKLQKEVDESSRSGWFSWVQGSKNVPVVSGDVLEAYPIDGELGNRTRETSLHPKKNAKPKVNVIALIAYDSPFFGLCENVFTIAAGEEIADYVTGFVPFEQPKEIVRSTVKVSTSLTSKVVLGIPSAATAVISGAAALPGATLNAASSGAGLALKLPGRVMGAITSLWTKSELDANSEFVKLKPDGSPKKTEVIIATESKLPEESPQTSYFSYINPLSYIINPLDYIPSFSNSNESSNIIKSEEISDEDDCDENFDDFQTTDSKLLPIPQDTVWTPWISLGITTAALAGGTYLYSGSLLAVASTSVVKRIALAYAISHANDATQRLQFLYPIWGESKSELEARFAALKKETEIGAFLFKNYYQTVKTVGKHENEYQIRTFVQVPQGRDYDRYFIAVGTDSMNEIAGHTNMFSRSENPGHYWDVVHKTSFDIKKIINKYKDSKQ